MSKAALQAKEKILQDEIEKYRGLQKEYQKAVASRNQLDAQLTENKNVKEELDVLEDDAVVYKLVGPVLVKQELAEAKQTLEKRLEYINKELVRYAGILGDLEKKQESAAEKLGKLQQDYQQAMLKAAATR
ncbi:hypothetical protein EMCRGX_G020175 [Ephydatia muelleri]